ncbi:hypothetical protein [Streptomyces laurentii]
MTGSPGTDPRLRRLNAWRGATKVLSRLAAEAGGVYDLDDIPGRTPRRTSGAPSPR